MNLKFPEDVKSILKRKYANNYFSWSGSSDFSLKIVLGRLTEKEVISYGQKFHKWVDQWKANLPGELIWEEYNWKIVGKQTLPTALILKNPRDVALWIDELNHWESFDQIKKYLAKEFSQLSPRLLNSIYMTYGNQISELDKLLSVVNWLVKNRNSNLYARQLPIKGIDSKWVEKNKDIITQVLIEITPKENETDDFYSITGLKSFPFSVRVRILDPKLSAKIAGITDLTINLDELIKLDLGASKILLVENLQSGLALGVIPETIAIMGMGNSVSLLASVAWLKTLKIYYWGDIDTYGFAILNQLRMHFPSCVSVLMDKKTLLDNIDYKSLEPKQYTFGELANLTKLESELFESLKTHEWGQSLRLEQERIPWEYAWPIMQKI